MSPAGTYDRSASVAILGAGRVGTALGVLARRHGHEVVAISGRGDARLRESARRIGGDVRITSAADAATRASLLFVTVPDDSIESLCAKLASEGAFRPGGIVAHCSGALTSEALAAARASAGCHVASFHPLQTFPDLDAALDDLPGSHCFLEGDAAAVQVLEAFGCALGLVCVAIERESKVLYHSAAVLACNYLATLMDAAITLNERAGIDREVGWQALERLVAATFVNVGRVGPVAALTGPIARGDTATIRLHLGALTAEDPRLEELYRALGRWTLDLARRKGSIDAARAQELDSLLAGARD